MSKERIVLYGLLLVLVGTLAYAYGGNSPTIMGHSAGELDVNISGTVMSLQDAIDGGDIGSGCKIFDVGADCWGAHCLWGLDGEVVSEYICKEKGYEYVLDSKIGAYGDGFCPVRTSGDGWPLSGSAYGNGCPGGHLAYRLAKVICCDKV